MNSAVFETRAEVGVRSAHETEWGTLASEFRLDLSHRSGQTDIVPARAWASLGPVTLGVAPSAFERAFPLGFYPFQGLDRGGLGSDRGGVGQVSWRWPIGVDQQITVALEDPFARLDDLADATALPRTPDLVLAWSGSQAGWSWHVASALRRVQGAAAWLGAGEAHGRTGGAVVAALSTVRDFGGWPVTLAAQIAAGPGVNGFTGWAWTEAGRSQPWTYDAWNVAGRFRLTTSWSATWALALRPRPWLELGVMVGQGGHDAAGRRRDVRATQVLAQARRFVGRGAVGVEAAWTRLSGPGADWPRDSTGRRTQVTFRLRWETWSE